MDFIFAEDVSIQRELPLTRGPFITHDERIGRELNGMEWNLMSSLFEVVLII